MNRSNNTIVYVLDSLKVCDLVTSLVDTCIESQMNQIYVTFIHTVQDQKVVSSWKFRRQKNYFCLGGQTSIGV